MAQCNVSSFKIRLIWGVSQTKAFEIHLRVSVPTATNGPRIPDSRVQRIHMSMGSATDVPVDGVQRRCALHIWKQALRHILATNHSQPDNSADDSFTEYQYEVGMTLAWIQCRSRGPWDTPRNSLGTQTLGYRLQSLSGTCRAARRRWLRLYWIGR